MTFKMKGFSPFTKMNEEKAKEKYEKAVKAGTVKPRYFKNFMYKLTGNNKYLKK